MFKQLNPIGRRPTPHSELEPPEDEQSSTGMAVLETWIDPVDPPGARFTTTRPSEVPCGSVPHDRIAAQAPAATA